MRKRYKIVVIPGDGIGMEVIPEAVKVLRAAQERVGGPDLEFVEFPAGGKYYLETGEEWPPEAFPTIKKEAHAVLFGAVGWNTPAGDPVRRKDGQLAGAGVVFGMRFGLDLYANVRPVRLYEGVPSVLADKGPREVDLVIVRENTEGLYQPIRGVLQRAGIEEMAVDVRVITRKGAERVIKYAFELSRRRQKGSPMDQKKRVTCVDKSNVLRGCQLFRAIYDQVAEGYPDVMKDYAYIDSFCQWLIRSPEWYDVAVTTNMFGDITTDLGAAIAGGMGIAASGNIGDEYAMFEPIHGSAPKHAGKREANPLGAILAAKMMMDWLGHKHDDSDCRSMGEQIERAVGVTLRDGDVRTYDLCRGPYSKVTPSSTDVVGNAVVEQLKRE